MGRQYKRLKPIKDYNYVNIYDYDKGHWNDPVRIRTDLTSSNRDSIIIYLKNIGLVDKYSMKLFKRMYTTIANQQSNLYDCFEFQEYLSNIWLTICEVPQSKWDEIWLTSGRTGITAYVSGIIHRTIISTSSISYKQVFKHAKENINYDTDGWKLIQETKTPEEIDPFCIGSW